jgi:hypothetical protein
MIRFPMISHLLDRPGEPVGSADREDPPSQGHWPGKQEGKGYGGQGCDLSRALDRFIEHDDQRDEIRQLDSLPLLTLLTFVQDPLCFLLSSAFSEDFPFSQTAKQPVPSVAGTVSGDFIDRPFEASLQMYAANLIE